MDSLRLNIFREEGRELVTIQAVEIKRSSFALSGDSDRVSALDYMSELALEFMPPHQSNPNMFRMIKACGEAVHDANVDVGRVTQYFELWTLRPERVFAAA
jgi:recombinational DNA repair protein (RecF pathway)